MFNYEAIDKTPTVYQIRAIIEYMENDKKVGYNFNNMLSFSRPDINTVIIDLNNAHSGINYKVVFEDKRIVSFETHGVWMS